MVNPVQMHGACLPGRLVIVHTTIPDSPRPGLAVGRADRLSSRSAHALTLVPTCRRAAVMGGPVPGGRATPHADPPAVAVDAPKDGHRPTAAQASPARCRLGGRRGKRRRRRGRVDRDDPRRLVGDPVGVCHPETHDVRTGAGKGRGHRRAARVGEGIGAGQIPAVGAEPDTGRLVRARRAQRDRLSHGRDRGGGHEGGDRVRRAAGRQQEAAQGDGSDAGEPPAAWRGRDRRVLWGGRMRPDDAEARAAGPPD